MSDADHALARSIIAQLQSALDDRDIDALVMLFAPEAVLIGSTAYNVGPGVREYLDEVVSQPASLRWELPRLDVFLRGAGTIGFGAHGEVVLTDEDIEQRAPFRLTIVAVEAVDGWRIATFHGSIPSGL